jgi:hypothetical protein
MIKFYIGEFFSVIGNGEDGTIRTVLLFHKLHQIVETESENAVTVDRYLRERNCEFARSDGVDLIGVMPGATTGDAYVPA